jgi:predicted transcriptional regulator YdeE
MSSLDAEKMKNYMVAMTKALKGHEDDIYSVMISIILNKEEGSDGEGDLLISVPSSVVGGDYHTMPMMIAELLAHYFAVMKEQGEEVDVKKVCEDVCKWASQDSDTSDAGWIPTDATEEGTILS